MKIEEKTKVEEVTSKELGESLFHFAVLSCKTFLNNFDKQKTLKLDKKVCKDDINQEELLIAYLWLVFHFLNIKGLSYEATTKYLHTAYLDFLDVPETEKDVIIDHLKIRYDEYKNTFNHNSNANFQALGLSVSYNILGIVTTDFVFQLSLSASMSESFVALDDLLQEVDIID